jgi:hypothetical protein
MDMDGDGGRREFGLRGQRRGTESDKGTRRKFALRNGDELTIHDTSQGVVHTAWTIAQVWKS